MAFNHGVSIQELDTKLVGVKTARSALPFIVGTAPVHNLTGDKPVNEPKLITDFPSYVETFGEVGEGESEDSFTLTRAARVIFNLYRMGPAIMVNVFDPDTHVDGSSNPDPSQVVAADIVGGYDSGTGRRTGLETIETVFPSFGMVPGIVLAPDFSHELTVANEMIAKAESINGLFKAMAYIDAPYSTVLPADAITFKGDISSPHAVVHFPSVTSGGYETSLSLQAAGLTAKVDEAAGGVPFESPSNKDLLIEGPKTILSIPEANSLNENGISTAFRFTAGWKLWGNRTAAFPTVTDLRDSFIPNRRMANWIENTLILLTWQKVDKPTNTRLIETVVSTVNIWLNGLRGAGALLGARVYFRKEDNPATDLASGKIKFYIRYLSPVPAEEISFLLEVDTSFFNELFS